MDVGALRFLFYRDEKLDEIVEYESLVHIFGASSSPPVANFTLQFHAGQIREKYGEEVYHQLMTLPRTTLIYDHNGDDESCVFQAIVIHLFFFSFSLI